MKKPLEDLSNAIIEVLNDAFHYFDTDENTHMAIVKVEHLDVLRREHSIAFVEPEDDGEFLTWQIGEDGHIESGMTDEYKLWKNLLVSTKDETYYSITKNGGLPIFVDGTYYWLKDEAIKIMDRLNSEKK